MRCLTSNMLAIIRWGAMCLCWLGWAGLPTVSAQYRFDHWTTDNGLPQNSVSMLVQTRDGYLWLATSDGVVRFDGVRFTVFNKGNTPGITSNRSSYLFEDRQGALWIGTEDGGLIRYHHRTFVAYTTQDGLPDNAVLRVDEDEAGDLWIITQTGIVRRQAEQFKLEAPRPGSPLNEFLPTQVKPGRARHGPWYADAKGVQRFAQGRVTTYPFAEDARQFDFNACFENPTGTLWFVTSTRGAYRYKDGRLTLWGAREGLPSTLTGLFEDQRGGIWVTSPKVAPLRWQDGKLTKVALPNFPMDLPLSVFQDREGTLWLYGSTGGLYRARPQIISNVRVPTGPEFNHLYALLQDRAGNVWLSAMSRYRDGQFTMFTQAAQPTATEVTAMFEDHDGDILFGTPKGIVRFAQGRFLREPNSPQEPVYAIHRDRAGALWMGTEHGLFRWDKDQMTRLSVAEGLAGEAVKAIIESRAGGLWIGTYGGVSHYQDGRFTTLPAMGSHRVRALYEDTDGVLWIGTYDGGLSRWKDDRMTTYSTRNGLFNDGAFQILEDRHGYLWMGCNLGIYRVRKAELNDYAAGRVAVIHCTNYNKADGMLNVECNGGRHPAGLVARDGTLWFPTQEGVAVVDPEAATVNPLPPPVVVEEIKINNESVGVETMESAIQFEALLRPNSAIQIKPGQSNLEIQYTGLSLIKSEQLKFRYRLLGLETTWTEAGTRRTAYYPHLPPGSYTFQVIAANSDGVWNNDGALLKIIVVPPFYRTWWFLTLVITSGIGVVLLAYQYRVRQLTRAKAAHEAFSRRLIESQEHERKRIAAELHDSLGQNLLIIKNRALLGTLSAAEPAQSHAQFTEISTSVSEAIEEVREIAYNLRPYHLDRLGLTQTIEAMIERVAAATGIAFTIEVPPLEGLLSAEAEINLYRVLQECVNNIARHSGATAARVLVTRETHNVIVVITDNGRGFSIANLQSVIQTPQSGGFGLAGIAERVRFLNGTHTIESAPGKGTTITIKLNLR